MAIRANINYFGVAISADYLRLERVQGNKKEGWTGTMLVYASAAKANPEGGLAPQPLPGSTFDVQAPFEADKSPYTGLYAAAKSAIAERLSATSISDV